MDTNGFSVYNYFQTNNLLAIKKNEVKIKEQFINNMKRGDENDIKRYENN